MEDKELFDFFKNRRTSFDEMPSDALWSKIQTNIDASKTATFFSVSKITILSVLILATALTIGCFIYTESKTAIEGEAIHPKGNEIIEPPSSTPSGIVSEIDSLKNPVKTDTLKPKKRVVKKPVVTVKNDAFSVIKKLQPVLKTDSLKVIASKIDTDSLKINPQVKGNRLLFETKKALTKTEFDSFIQKVLDETKTNYGALIVVKAKGNIPFRQIVKFPKKIDTLKNPNQPSFYKTRVIVEDSLISNDSINSELKDRYFTH